MSVLNRIQRKDDDLDKQNKRERDAGAINQERIIKKRKKDPPKPWGKKERLLILFFIVITVGTSGILALSARSWKLPGIPRLKAPSFNLLKEETIVIEGQNANKKDLENSKEALAEFEEKTKALSGVYGLYVENLDTGFSFGVDEKEVFQAASLIKLPVMLAMYMEAQKGDLNLETVYSLKNSDKTAGSGVLYAKPAGTKLTYRELVEYMGNKSDNTAFTAAVGIVGKDKINETIDEIGMTNTSLESNETSPYDIGLLFKKLMKGELVKNESRDEILGFLTDTSYENWLRAGIPKEVRVTHKYGRELHVVNDAGIVFTKDPFILVILSKGVVESEADKVFPELARIIYNAQTQ